MGQDGSERDSQWDSGGTSSLKRLAAAVLARDSGWDKRGTRAATPVPHSFPLVPPVRAAAHRPPEALPGVPAAWCEGIALLISQPSPASIMAHRWCLFQADAARVLRQHGAELDAAGWDGLALFGLHRTAPAVRPDCMGLAWLLQGRDVGTVTPQTVGILTPTSGTQRMWKPGDHARRETTLAWQLA